MTREMGNFVVDIAKVLLEETLGEDVVGKAGPQVPDLQVGGHGSELEDFGHCVFHVVAAGGS